MNAWSTVRGAGGDRSFTTLTLSAERAVVLRWHGGCCLPRDRHVVGPKKGGPAMRTHILALMAGLLLSAVAAPSVHAYPYGCSNGAICLYEHSYYGGGFSRFSGTADYGAPSRG